MDSTDSSILAERKEGNAKTNRETLDFDVLFFFFFVFSNSQWAHGGKHQIKLIGIFIFLGRNFEFNLFEIKKRKKKSSAPKWPLNELFKTL